MAVELINANTITNNRFDLQPEDSLTATNGNTFSRNTILSELYLRISTNKSEFTTLIDGEPTGNNKFITLPKSSFIRTPTKVEVSKNGYTSNEYYIIEMLPDGSPIINNSNFSNPLGLSTKELSLRKFKDGRFISDTKINTNNLTLEFDFYRDRSNDTPTEYTVDFNIIGEGTPVSVLKNNLSSAEFFPPIGENDYVDLEGTTYTIRSTDLDEYRITKIVADDGNNQPEELIAKDDESLEITVDLNGNYEFNISTERIPKPIEITNPVVRLVNPLSRRYNINSKEGVPLLLRKNNDVSVITIIIGDDILEFDDLDSGDTCGVVIPHESFNQIGKYNVKIFPFSFDDYEEQLSEVSQQVDITERSVDIKFKTKEEPTPTPPTPPANTYNPYIPINRGGRGDQRFDNPTIGLDPISGTNNGSFVNNPVTRIRIR